MQVQDAYRTACQRLRTSRQDEAERKAKLILAWLLDCRPAELVLHGQRQLSAAQVRRLTQILTGLEAGQPLQYLLQSVEFMGLSLTIGPGVLIPRPDTEIIAEAAIRLVQDRSAPLIADLGTGSGALAVSLAHYLPEATVYAVDLEPQAVVQARRNAARLGVNCNFLEGDLTKPLQATGRQFDLIISNPPYISVAEMAELPAEVRCEPTLALYGGEDGLDYYRRLARECLPLLREDGWLVLEHGWQQQQAVADLLTDTSWLVTERLHDYGQRPRGIVAQKNRIMS